MDASTAFKPAAPDAVDRALTISHLHKEYRTGHPVPVSYTHLTLPTIYSV